MKHFHACMRCGKAWEHDTPEDDNWRRDHSCQCGKLCTIKYDREVADGIRAAPDEKTRVQFLYDHDPYGFLTYILFGDEA